MPEPALDTEGTEQVLVVVAHPDDVDFGSGGSIARWRAAGIGVQYCIITDGDAGGYDASVTRSEMRTIRRQEQTAAAHVLGVERVHFLGYPDGRLVVSHELRRDITRVIRTVKPDRVLCQSPERNYQRIFASHPDHLAAGEATLCAVYPDARNQFAHPELLAEEGLGEHIVREVWVTAMAAPDRFVDITDTVDRKVAALRAHASQTAHMDDLDARIREWGARLAELAGWPEGRFAEAYQVVPTA